MYQTLMFIATIYIMFLITISYDIEELRSVVEVLVQCLCNKNQERDDY
jgi:hypothetical protein